VTACAVVGAGAWGTALANLLARNGHAVQLWAREPDVAATINAGHTNDRFFPGIMLAPSLRATTELEGALEGAALVVYAVPSEHLRAVARHGAAVVAATATLVVATKGIEPDTRAVMTDVIAEVVPRHPVVALSGPSFAAEVGARQPTAVVAASLDARAAERVQRAMATADFRVYRHDDVVGVGLAGAIKNVIAIAIGVADGLGLGANTRAALITRGLAEMTRLGVARGAQRATFAGLAGLGDLVLTCTGSLSRNRAVGEAIGRGSTLADALAGRETVAEGVVNARAVLILAGDTGVEMPIVQAVNRVLFEGRSARQSIADLMERELRSEPD
jgi:glycerol-3-phosphate dehydrogenase (NAD(P)+)